MLLFPPVAAGLRASRPASHTWISGKMLRPSPLRSVWRWTRASPGPGCTSRRRRRSDGTAPAQAALQPPLPRGRANTSRSSGGSRPRGPNQRRASCRWQQRRLLRQRRRSGPGPWSASESARPPARPSRVRQRPQRVARGGASRGWAPPALPPKRHTLPLGLAATRRGRRRGGAPGSSSWIPARLRRPRLRGPHPSAVQVGGKGWAWPAATHCMCNNTGWFAGLSRS